MNRVEHALRRLVMGTPLEPYARFVWKRVLRRRSKNDVYDDLTLAVMERVLDRRSNCVDVGCHQGFFLDNMLSLAPDGTHYAFEPVPALFRHLQDKYASRPNVMLRDLALSNTSGTISFQVNRDHPGYSGIERRDYPSAGDRVEVVQVGRERLDAVIPVNTRIDFIKIDVEGAELMVLEGAVDQLRRHRPVVVFEHGPEASQHYDTGPEKIFDLLAKCGLRLSLLEAYMAEAAPLGRSDFVQQVDSGSNFYFVAHP
jgi:FkbM family methyltransferase